ncbi:hypothetical protein BV898_10211 [Hypsibius exemplaris]|uniref:Uncharacterized protein n=1 Tax=Hypsibius exemplaris TaxID=2072580 RepID=A0A1W0WKG9_HYPEX|nr:hypothetical protein BV898_10211 [Hypsibius exemplaris]
MKSAGSSMSTGRRTTGHWTGPNRTGLRTTGHWTGPDRTGHWTGPDRTGLRTIGLISRCCIFALGLIITVAHSSLADSDLDTNGLSPEKQKVLELLKSIETGSSAPFAYVNPNKYIQHNLDIAPGPAGVQAFIASLNGSARVRTVRVFQLRNVACLQKLYPAKLKRVSSQNEKIPISVVLVKAPMIPSSRDKPFCPVNKICTFPAILEGQLRANRTKTISKEHIEETKNRNFSNPSGCKFFKDLNIKILTP